MEVVQSNIEENTLKKKLYKMKNIVYHEVLNEWSFQLLNSS